MVLPLSILDLSPIATGSSSPQALRNTIDPARLADRLGYTRYWPAERHNMPGVASSAPEILIGHVASATTRIRVGSGGIMLPNHTALKVVETFRILEALHPDRIDLGIGRAPAVRIRCRRSPCAAHGRRWEPTTSPNNWRRRRPSPATDSRPAGRSRP